MRTVHNSHQMDGAAQLNLQAWLSDIRQCSSWKASKLVLFACMGLVQG